VYSPSSPVVVSIGVFWGCGSAGAAVPKKFVGEKVAGRMPPKVNEGQAGCGTELTVVGKVN